MKMQTKTDKIDIKANVKLIVDNIPNFNWKETDKDIAHLTDDIYFATTSFGYYTIKQHNHFPRVYYSLYFNDFVISDYVEDICSLPNLAIKDYKDRLYNALNYDTK